MTTADIASPSAAAAVPAVSGTAGISPARRPLITAANLRDNIVVITVFLYLFFSYVFMQLGIPFAGKIVPIGELVLLFAVLTIHLPAVLPRLLRSLGTGGSLALCAFWLIALAQLAVSIPTFGLWALRDATNAIESLFLFVGFVFAADPRNLKKLTRYLPAVIAVLYFHSLLYPVLLDLEPLAPSITTGGGYRISILQQQNASWVMLIAAITALADRKRFGKLRYLMAVIAVGYVFVFFQARTAYGQMIAAGGILLWYSGKRWKMELIRLMTLLLAALVLAIMVGPFLPGRLGENFSFRFLVEHIASSTGDNNLASKGAGEAGGGILLRLVWWADIIKQWLASWKNFLFGRGYGFPLIDFVAYGFGYDEEGQIVREPHNSYLSVIARLGLTGILSFLAFQAAILWRTVRNIVRLKAVEPLRRFSLVALTFFVMVILLSLAEDGFEKPYNTVPYYFLAGVMLRMSLTLDQLSRQHLQPVLTAGG